MPDIQDYMLVSIVLFFIGAIGFLARKNIFSILMCIELMLNASNLIFASVAYDKALISGQVAILMVIALAAAEAAFGFAVIMMIYKNSKKLDIDLFRNIRD